MIQEIFGYSVEEITIFTLFCAGFFLTGFFAGWITQRFPLIFKIPTFICACILFLTSVDSWSEGGWSLFIVFLGFIWAYREGVQDLLYNVSLPFRRLFWWLEDLRYRFQERLEHSRENKLKREWAKLRDERNQFEEERKGFWTQKKRLENKDPYKILDVSRDDSLKVIKDRRRKLIEVLHSDRLRCPKGYICDQIENLVKEINNAFDEIKKDKRWWS